MRHEQGIDGAQLPGRILRDLGGHLPEGEPDPRGGGRCEALGFIQGGELGVRGTGEFAFFLRDLRSLTVTPVVLDRLLCPGNGDDMTMGAATLRSG